MMRMEARSPEDALQEGGSFDAFDHSEDEPENEVEALQQLPPDERRKALRRLRNRESARRVRARRLAEMNSMESTVQGMSDEISQLRAHVSKLNDHIQSMTLKVYEVTAKYEAAVAENAQLRSELQNTRRPSLPESSIMAPGCPNSAVAHGPNSAPTSLSPFMAPSAEASPFVLPSVPAGVAQLRVGGTSTEVQQQRMDEVMTLLHEHKRRHRGPERSVCSDMAMGSTAHGNASSLLNNGGGTRMSEGVALPAPYGGGGLSLNPSGSALLSQATAGGPMGSLVEVPRTGSSGVRVGGPPELLPGGGLQQTVRVRDASQGGMCQQQVGMVSSVGAMQVGAGQCQQLQPAQAGAFGVPLLQQAQQQHVQAQAQQQLLMQSASSPLPLLQVQAQAQQQHGAYAYLPAHHQRHLSGAPLSSASNLTAPFFSAASALTPAGQQQQHSLCMLTQDRSGSCTSERRAGGASGGDFSLMHTAWGGGGGGAVTTLAGCTGHRGGGDITEDIFMSLDEFFPQDL